MIYFNEVYSLNNIENTKYYTIFKDRLSFLDLLKIKDFNKKEADEKFREISNVSLITEQDYNENIELIENIKRGENVHINLSKLRKYAINVSLKSIIYGKNKFTATDIGIKGFFMTNNVYSKEQGLTYSVDDNNFL